MGSQSVVTLSAALVSPTAVVSVLGSMGIDVLARQASFLNDCLVETTVAIGDSTY